MPSTVLLVLIVRDASTRSGLIARLSLAGADLITAANVHDPALLRGGTRPRVLIVDEASIAEGGPDWLGTVLEESRWRQVIVLTDAPPALRAPDANPRLTYVRWDAAASVIAELAPGWQPEDPEE